MAEITDPAQNIVTYEVAKMVVINPPVLGRRRIKRFHAHTEKCQSLPSEHIIGINKNHLDFSGCQCSVLPKDRSPWVEMKIKNGWEPRVISFQDEYARYFDLGYGKYYASSPEERAKSGAIACALSHILAWQYIAKTIQQNQVAMVVEDDVFLNTQRTFTTIQMPQEADVLHFNSAGRYTQYSSYDEAFLRVVRAVSTRLYFITKLGAQKLLAETLPLPINREIDWHIFRVLPDAHKASYQVFTEKRQITECFDIFGSRPNELSFIKGSGLFTTRWRLPTLTGLKYRVCEWLRTRLMRNRKQK